MSDANDDQIQPYLLEDESITYSFSVRSRGLWAWLKSLFGYGVTTWYLTNQRLIDFTRITGGFTFQDVASEKISSVEYGQQLNIPALVAGGIAAFFGLFALLLGDQVGLGILLIVVGAGIAAYAYYRRKQALNVYASGGANLQLVIQQGDQVDDFLWYLNATRQNDGTPPEGGPPRGQSQQPRGQQPQRGGGQPRGQTQQQGGQQRQQSGRRQQSGNQPQQQGGNQPRQQGGGQGQQRDQY